MLLSPSLMRQAEQRTAAKGFEGTRAHRTIARRMHALELQRQQSSPLKPMQPQLREPDKSMVCPDQEALPTHSIPSQEAGTPHQGSPATYLLQHTYHRMALRIQQGS